VFRRKACISATRNRVASEGWASEMPKTSNAERLRVRGMRMLELATRAHCEQNYDFARLLTQLAFEVLNTRERWNNPTRTAASVSRFSQADLPAR
jgi:hypothetical protein